MVYFSILPPEWLGQSVPKKEDIAFILSLTFAVTYALVRNYVIEREVFSFSMVWVFVALFILLAGLSEQVIRLAFLDVEIVQIRAVSYFWRLVIISAGLSGALLFIRKLVLFKAGKREHIIWSIMEVIIIATYFFNLFYFRPEVSMGILIVLSIALLYFLFQLRWLLFISRKELFQSLVAILLTLIAVYFIIESLRSPELLTYLLVPFYRNSAWVMATGFIGAYALISLLGMVIILPLRGVIEEFREAEHFMEQLITEHRALTEWIEELAQRAMERTSSDGIMIRIPDKGIQVKMGVLPSETRLMLICDASMDSCSYMIDNNIRNEESIQSQCIIPIVLEEKCRGILCAFKSVRFGYDVYLVRLLEEIAYQISLVLMYEESMERREAITRANIMLETARTVQLNLLPDRSFESNIVEISVFFKPAQEVGGDIYWWKKSNERVAFALADVSGKGIQAAFIMAYLRGVLDGLPSQNWDISFVPAYIENATRHILMAQEKFITMVWLCAKKESIEIVRCGHPSPIWISASGVKVLSGGALPPVPLISLVEKQEVGIKLEEPGILVLYSDGLSELRIIDNDGEETFLGEEGIAKVLETAGISTEDSAEDVLHKFLNRLREYYGSDTIEFDDDVVIAVVRYMQ